VHSALWRLSEATIPISITSWRNSQQTPPRSRLPRIRTLATLVLRNGIVCVLDGKPSTRLAKLLGDNTAVAIFHKKTKDSPEATVRAADVLKLINFLPYVGWRYRMQAIQ